MLRSLPYESGVDASSTLLLSYLQYINIVHIGSVP